MAETPNNAGPVASDSTFRRTRRRVADVLFSRNKDEAWTRVVDISLILLIALNVVAVMLDSVHTIHVSYGVYLHTFELVSVLVFSLEYVLRIWSAVDNPWQAQYRRPLVGRLRFAGTAMAVIDLLAILPFYLGAFGLMDLRFLRVLRLLRIFKLTRYSGSMTLLFQVLRAEARTVGAALFVLLLMLVIASSLAFMVEGVSHPGGGFASIPEAMYWGVITMTTVGYGDVVPSSPAGKLLTSVLAIISVAMVALPAGILASGFTSAVQRRREQMEDKIEEALADGSFSAEDEAEIADLVERLNMSEADVRAIRMSVHRDMGDARPCPHCGRKPDEPGTQP